MLVKNAFCQIKVNNSSYSEWKTYEYLFVILIKIQIDCWINENEYINVYEKYY